MNASIAVDKNHLPNKTRAEMLSFIHQHAVVAIVLLHKTINTAKQEAPSSDQ